MGLDLEQLAAETAAAEADSGRERRRADTAAVVTAHLSGYLTETELVRIASGHARRFAPAPNYSEEERAALAQEAICTALRRWGDRGADPREREQRARRAATEAFPSPQDRGRRIATYLRVIENSANVRHRALRLPRDRAPDLRGATRSVVRDDRGWRDNAASWKQRDRDVQRRRADVTIEHLERSRAYVEAEEARLARDRGDWEAVALAAQPMSAAAAVGNGADTAEAMLADVARRMEAVPGSSQNVTAALAVALAPQGDRAAVARELGCSLEALKKRAQSGLRWIKAQEEWSAADVLGFYRSATAPEAAERAPVTDAGALRSAPRVTDAEGRDLPGARAAFAIVERGGKGAPPIVSEEVRTAGYYVTETAERERLHVPRLATAPMRTTGGPSVAWGERAPRDARTLTFHSPDHVSLEALAWMPTPGQYPMAPTAYWPDGITVTSPTYSDHWEARLVGWIARQP